MSVRVPSSKQHGSHSHSTCYHKGVQSRTRRPNCPTRSIPTCRSHARRSRTNRSRWRLRVHPVHAQRGRRKRRKPDRSGAIPKHRIHVFLRNTQSVKPELRIAPRESPTRNVSPMIQFGVLPLVLISKNAPTHWVGPIWVS